MTRKMSPWAVRLAVIDSVHDAVPRAVSRAVVWAVWWAVRRDVTGTVYDSVEWAMERAVFQAALARPQHPNLQRFVGEIRQARARRGAA